MDSRENSEELYSDTFTEEENGEEESGAVGASEEISLKDNFPKRSEIEKKPRKSTSVWKSQLKSELDRPSTVHEVWYQSFQDTLENITPKKTLLRAKRKAKMLARKGENDLSLREFIRCVALARIVYGDEHWRLAEAQVSLAEAYLDLKDFGLQALDHSECARDIMLLRLHSPPTEKKKADILRVLLRIYLTMGRAQTRLKKCSESEQNLLKAERLAVELCKMNSEAKAEGLQLKVTKAIGRMYFAAKKYNKAVESLRNVLCSMESCYGTDDPRTVPIHQDLGYALQCCQMKSQEEALDHFKKALHLTYKYFSPKSEEVALAEFALAKAYLTTANEEFYDLAENHLRNALKSVSSQCLYVEIEDQLIQFLIRLGREDEATSHLQAMIPKKAHLFGEGSPKVIHSYKLLSSLFLAIGQMEEAVKILRKCLDLQVILYGRSHQHCQVTERTLNIILENPCVSKKFRHRDSSLKNRPVFVSTVVSHNPIGN